MAARARGFLAVGAGTPPGFAKFAVMAGFRFARLAQDGAQVGFKVAGQIDLATDNGPFDSVLAELMFRTIFEDFQQIIFGHAHAGR